MTHTVDWRDVFSVSTSENLDREDDVFLVSGDCIVRLRDGVAERLEGTEKERARRWLLRDVKPAP